MEYSEASRYQIIKQIGEGGGGTVYLATDSHLQKQVVLKKIKGASSILDCRTEVDILKNLRHSYIPQVFDFIESEEGIYTVMDFIPGKSLQNMLDEGHKFNEKQVIKYASELCEALAYLHSQNPPLIHGDIKPDNIMITPQDHVCLIDFNISGFLEGQGMQTFGYTPGYSSPEQIEAFNYTAESFKRAQEAQQAQNQAYNGYTGDGATVMLGGQDQNYTYTGAETTVLLSADGQQQSRPAPAPQQPKPVPEPDLKAVTIDARADIYSVGATIYTLLTGKKVDINSKHLKLSNHVSDGLRMILSKSLEIKPRRRYQNASEMLEALRHVQEKDRAYRSLIRRQHFTIIVYAIILIASVAAITIGRDRMASEREERYASYITQLKSAVDDNLSPDAVDELFDGALEIHEDSLDAYYAKAYYLYYTLGTTAEQDGVSTEDFLEKATDKLLTGEDSMYSNLYYLYADCQFSREAYAEAAENYDKAVMYDDGNYSVYRDYAISLIYLGKYDEAEALLNAAVSKGMTKADIYLVQGELARGRGQYEDSVTCFEKVVAAAEDEYLLQRAYILAGKSLMAIGTEKSVRKNVDWLNKAAQQLSMSNRVLVYEDLAQAYIKLGEMTSDNECYSHAIDVFENIIEMNWGSYVTYSNLVVLNQRIDDQDAAKSWADKMCDRYPDNYVSYMRRAFVEIELQSQKAEDDRAYDTFVDCFNKASEKYKRVQANNQTDSEMLLLQNTYRQLVDGNWITE